MLGVGRKVRVKLNEGSFVGCIGVVTGFRSNIKKTSSINITTGDIKGEFLFYDKDLELLDPNQKPPTLKQTVVRSGEIKYVERSE